MNQRITAMKLTFLGGADEVGASCTLIEMGGRKILVDAGIRINPKTSRGIQNDQLPHLAHLTDVGGVDAILVTHAHTDHIGALAQVAQQFPHVPIYATTATQLLAQVLLLDSVRLMRGRFDAEGELPIYDDHALERLFNNWQTVEFLKALRLGEHLQATFHPSGHIVGAGMIVFESPEGVLVMSGDVSMTKQRAVVHAMPPRIKADVLVLESTYGGRAHANRQTEEKRLIDTLKQVAEQGGKVLIPAFALGRAQEVLQILLAYRDVLNVPVYADGMVRAVCDAYSQLTDILPKATVTAAGDQPLFFRQNVHPIKSKAQRDYVLLQPEPCIIVASSGMLTGGASVDYATQLAGDERNAIFLTGYQDEESPGRFLQNVMKLKQQGETPILKLGKASVALRCQLGQYSLSAHADESELVSFTESLDAERVFLVHGDEEARGSLWQALLQRGRGVARVSNGEEKAIPNRRRLDVAPVSEEGRGNLTAEALWTLLKIHASQDFTARELAQIWFGDVERSEAVVEVLRDDGIYFTSHWHDHTKFTVKTATQVHDAKQAYRMMRTHPDLVGQWVVLRTVNHQPRLAVVIEQGKADFKAVTQGAKGEHYSGHQLLWALGSWDGTNDQIKLDLNERASQVESLCERLLPLSERRRIARLGEAVQPEQLWEGLQAQHPQLSAPIGIASVVYALAKDGAVRVKEGLLIQRALPSEPLNQQDAIQHANRLFPLETRLRKVGVLLPQQTLVLHFDFPLAASEIYADLIETLRIETGWRVTVKMATNQQALIEVANELLRVTSMQVVKAPSIYLDQQEVRVEVEGEAELRPIEQRFYETTRYKLILIRRTQAQSPTLTATSEGFADAPANGEQVEFNTAAERVRQMLGAVGLNRVSLKDRDMVLTFITPQVGARHEEAIRALSQQLGYRIHLHPQPMQNLVLDIAKRLLREGALTISKGPGIHVDRAEVSVKVLQTPDEGTLERLSDALVEETGYRLVVR
ncbi:MAG: MBL fold metallo-hydrolase [Phototrophicaceae bacterium]